MRFHIEPSSLARYVDRHCVDERYKGDVIRLALAHFGQQDLQALTRLATTVPRHPFPLYGWSAQARHKALVDLKERFVPGDILVDITQHETARRDLDSVLHLIAYASRAPAIAFRELADEVSTRFRNDATTFQELLSFAAEVSAAMLARREGGLADWLISEGRLSIYRVNGDEGLRQEAASIGVKVPPPSDTDLTSVSIRDTLTGETQAIIFLDRLWIADVLTPINWRPRDGKTRHVDAQTYDILPYIDCLRGDILKVANIARASVGGVAMMGLRQATLLDGCHHADTVRFSVVNGVLESIGGEPALSIGDHRHEWRRDGRLHRDAGPAVVRSADHDRILQSFPHLESALDLDREFITELPITDRWQFFAEEHYRDGRLHRDDGPALSGGVDGLSATLRRGQLHATDDAAMRDDLGLEIHAQNGVLHRDEGYAVDIPGDFKGSMLNGKYMPIGNEPTIVSADGRRTWMANGRIYRTDGPTVIHPDGTEEWAIPDADGKIDPFGALETRSPARSATPTP